MCRPASRAGSVALALAASAGCARELPPPGTAPDQIPPSVETIEPEPESVVPGFDGRIRIRYDEPVNIPQDIGRRLFASPMERYEVETGFSDMALRPRDGWRDSVVYCYRIPEGITDLLRNRTEDPTTFCFSTGIEIADTGVSGTVLDALTGNPVSEGRILFYATGDSTPYGAVTDQEGGFAARALPPNEYEAFAFIDQNRDLRLDRGQEAHDSVRFVASVEARPSLELRVIPPDSTPPRLVRVTAVDSLTLELEFDDPLRNPQDEEPDVAVRDTLTGNEIPVLAARVGRGAEADLPPPPFDSAAAAPADTGAAPSDSVGPGADPAAVPPERETQDAGPPLPSRFVSVRMASPLVPAAYRAFVEGAVNLRRLSGGGDTTFVYAPPADSAAAVPDTTGVPVDSAAVPTPAPDSLRASPDSVSTPPDTAGTAGPLPARLARGPS
ncbi:MAG: carboxypeptidase regulatory-like domain-containing protein [Gemmatimonadota bacterium]|nr:carboxypeptidase regulatory-like domain-containing protein [Gemmatimonadota bacterium]